METVFLYGFVQNQQHYPGTSGHFGGVRMEAVIAVAQWLWEAGDIFDMDEAIRRVSIIDSVHVKQHNDKVDAEIEAAKNR